MATSKDQALFLLDFCKLVQEATRLGFLVTGGEIHRTLEQQKIYFNTGRSKTMNSRHLDKMAGDLNFIHNGVYVPSLPGAQVLALLEPVGKYWESLSPKNRWGGNFDMDWTRKDPFVDAPHFERRD